MRDQRAAARGRAKFATCCGPADGLLESVPARWCSFATMSSIVLYHHPFSRAANVVWMLEEVGAPYELRFVDIMKGEQKKPDILALNRMGKLPIVVDDGTVVTEAAAIAMYLGDRYAYGKLAPKVDDPARGTYFRWTFF